MIPNITRGSRMGGLLAYLAGPGKRNEHDDPHLVAGNQAMMMWHRDTSLDRNSALTVARHLDRPHRAYDTEIKDGHVWHCSLAINVEEGVLSDDRWREISESMIRRMGFDDAEGTKPGTRWVSVRHGVSQNGNDHVHLVVNLVREDGTKAPVFRDFKRAQDAARDIEREFGLRQLDVGTGQHASIGYAPGEREAVARRRARGKFEQARRDGHESRAWFELHGTERRAMIEAQMRDDQPRWALARKVRASATAAQDEGEFVRRLRRQGVLVRPRYAEGTTDVITGYSVASRPQYGERPIWYGGGSLAHDLSLNKLRSEWPDRPEGAIEAAAEWNAAKRGRRPLNPGREMNESDPQLWQEAGRDVERLRDQLRSVPVEDVDTWARVARQTSGAFAAWSSRVEAVPGPFAEAADALGRSAELRRTKTRPERTPVVSLAGTAMVLAAVSKKGNTPAANLAMLNQLVKLSGAIHDTMRASQDARRAQLIETKVARDLKQVKSALEEATRQHNGRDPLSQQLDAAIAHAQQPRETTHQTVRAGDLDSGVHPSKPSQYTTTTKGVER